MIDKRVYDYLIQESKQHSLSEIKKRLLAAGHDLNMVNETINAVKQQIQPRPVQRSNLPNMNMQKTSMNSVAVKNLPTKKTVKPVFAPAKMKTLAVPQKSMKQLKPLEAKPMKAKPAKQLKQMKMNGKAKPMKVNGKIKPIKAEEIGAPKKSKKWLWILLVIFFLLIGAGVVYYFFFSS